VFLLAGQNFISSSKRLFLRLVIKQQQNKMEGDRPNPAVIQQFQQMKQELNALAQTIGDKEIEKSEHEYVPKYPIQF
jgi:hypothetical protein